MQIFEERNFHGLSNSTIFIVLFSRIICYQPLCSIYIVNHFKDLIFVDEKLLVKITSLENFNVYGVLIVISQRLLIKLICIATLQVTADLQGVYICDMGIAKLRAASEATVTTAMPYMPKGLIHTWHQKCMGVIPCELNKKNPHPFQFL